MVKYAVPDSDKMTTIKDYGIDSKQVKTTDAADVYEDTAFQQDVTTLRLLYIDKSVVIEKARVFIENSRKISLEFSENGKLLAVFKRKMNEVLLYNIETEI